jgi:hypothetical protein
MEKHVFFISSLNRLKSYNQISNIFEPISFSCVSIVLIRISVLGFIYTV